MANGKPSAAEAIAAGPSGGTGDLPYLGVPEGYVAPRRVQGPTPTGEPLVAQPQYVEGDQYEPGGGSPEDVARLQQTLDRTGLFQKGQKYRLGVWDDTSISAYTRLLEFANQQGYDRQDALRIMGELTPEQYDEMYGKGAWARSSGTGKVGAEDIPRGTVNARMSEDDLRYLAQRTARKSLGRSLTDAELSQFSGAYTTMLNQATSREASALSQADAGANVTYQSATSPEVFAEQQAQRTDPNAFEARRQVGVLRSIGGMLGELGGS